MVNRITDLVDGSAAEERGLAKETEELNSAGTWRR